MRARFIAIAALGVALVISLSAFVLFQNKDWDNMNKEERLTWTSHYVQETCPHGLDLTAEDSSNDDDIAWVPKVMVTSFISGHCKHK